MVHSINQSIQSWNTSLDQIQRGEGEEAQQNPSTRLLAIARGCFSFRSASRELVDNDVSVLESLTSIEQSLTSIEQRANGLFLRCLREGRVGDNDFGNAFILAAESGDRETLQVLMEHIGRVSDRDFSSSFVNAVKADGTTLRMLIDTGRQVSDEVFNEALESSGKGDGTTLSMLLATGREISDPGFSRAFRNAARSDGTTLRILLDTGREVSDDVIGVAFQNAATADGTTLTMLMPYVGSRLFDQYFAEAFRRSSYRDGTTLAMLMPHIDRVNDEDFSRAFSCAAYNYNGTTLRMLMDTGRPVSDEAFSEALRSSLRERSKNAISLLILSGRQIADIDLRNRATLFAASRGRLDLVEAILRQGTIHPSARDSAITQASGEQRDAIRDMLRMARTEQPSAAVARPGRGGASHVSLAAIKESPLEWLNIFCALDALPSSFSLTESPQAIDLGGVSKQVYSELISALIAKDILSIRSSGLVCSEEGMHLATAHLLGTFFSLLDEKNSDRSDKFLTGHVFSSAFYEIARHLLVESSSEEKQVRAAAILKEIETELAPCFAWIESKDETSKQDISQLMEVMSEDGSPEEYALGVLKGFLAPIEAFLDGASDRFKARIKDTAPNDLRIQIQGEVFTKETLKGALRIGQEPQLATQLDWIKEKIDASDKTWQKAFLYAITGRETMTPNTEIKIRASWRNVFEIHTCFNSLDLPSTEMSKEEFLAALDAVIQGVSYNIA